MLKIDDVPRRIRVDKNSPAELAIRLAMAAVEALPADVRLSKAGTLLQEALDNVADYIDEHALDHICDPAQSAQPPEGFKVALERYLSAGAKR